VVLVEPCVRAVSGRLAVEGGIGGGGKGEGGAYSPADILGQLDALQMGWPDSSLSWTTRTKFHRLR
jgi:hypothetical protein